MGRFCRDVLRVVVLHRLKANNLIGNPASCEILAVIRLRKEKKITTAEIHKNCVVFENQV